MSRRLRCSCWLAVSRTSNASALRDLESFHEDPDRHADRSIGLERRFEVRDFRLGGGEAASFLARDRAAI